MIGLCDLFINSPGLLVWGGGGGGFLFCIVMYIVFACLYGRIIFEEEQLKPTQLSICCCVLCY